MTMPAGDKQLRVPQLRRYTSQDLINSLGEDNSNSSLHGIDRKTSTMLGEVTNNSSMLGQQTPVDLLPDTGAVLDNSGDLLLEEEGSLIQDTEALVKDLSQLVGNEDTADVVFLVGPQHTAFYAHKLLLWSRCRAFQRYQHQFWRSRSSPGPLTFKYPQYEADTFKQVLHYIYTGQVILSDSSVFPVMVLGRDMGVDVLTQQCENYIQQNINENNACYFLLTAFELEKENLELEVRSQSYIKACMKYIEQHADLCVKSEGWLQLSKEAVIQLISSDSFVLEEENVWRAVLSWGKYQAGIALDQQPQHWSAQERNHIKQNLQGVVDHVKVMFIDSQVYAEEVEPTGLLPMQMSLERYRSAALPEKSPSEYSDYQPRVTFKFFQASHILDRDKTMYQRLLNQWYGEPRQMWSVIYRASRDGYCAEDFHRFCDGKAPTFTIIQGTTGNICGGFSDVPWSSNTPPRGRFIPSNRCFLFTLVNNQGVSPSKFEVKKSKYATLHHPDYGPMFGGGSDLCITSPCNQGMECYSNLPHSYDGENASASILMGDYNFNVVDYEVFTLADEVQQQS